MKFSEVPVRKWVKTFKISIIFTIFYVGINGIVLLINGFKYPVNPIFTFLTSWFNLSEDYLKLYDNFYLGFTSNYVGPLAIITIYECYHRITSLKHKIYFFTAEYSFIFGILATYLTSARNWIAYKSPGSGSSILAFCFFIALIIYMLIEVILIAEKKFSKGETTDHWSLKKHLYVRIVLILTLSYSAYAMFVYNNRSWTLHIDGLMFFIILAAIFLLRRIKLSHIKQRKMNTLQE